MRIPASAAVFILISLPAASAQSQSWRTVALTGGPANGLPGSFVSLERPVMNDRGHVAFLGRVSPPNGGEPVTGIWADGEDGQTRLVAHTGQSVSGLFASAPIQFLGPPAYNNLAEIAFQSYHLSPPGSDFRAILHDHPTTGLQPIAHSGQQPPTFPSDSVFRFFDDPSLRDVTDSPPSPGHVFFSAQLADPVSNSTRGAGAWQGGPGLAPARILFDADVIPGLTHPLHVIDFPRMSALNEGQIAYAPPSIGLLRTDAETGQWQVVLDDRAPMPGNAGNVDDIVALNMNESGQMAFQAALIRSNPPTQPRSIWIEEPAGLKLLAIDGAKPPGEQFATWNLQHNDQIVINNAGIAAWWSGLNASFRNDTGIWIYQGGAVRQVVREGDQVPGQPAGEHFNVLIGPYLNESGQLLFAARTGTDASPSQNSSVWIRQPDGALQLIASRGDVLDVDNGPGLDLRTIQRVGFTGHKAAQRFTDCGDALLHALFTDGTEGLFVVSPELPGDFNGDATVDAADYVIWRKRDNSQVGYDMWRANFGQSAQGIAASSRLAAVPEPSVFSLAAAACLIHISRRGLRHYLARVN
jgi:hypothetical protein